MKGVFPKEKGYTLISLLTLWGLSTNVWFPHVPANFLSIQGEWNGTMRVMVPQHFSSGTALEGKKGEF